ncbi:MAG: flippase-like domain-containing protein [Calditrichaeota bacterium]|nr:flippase-like domain-containing protein [Calditrichota bacterium]MCB9069938.1 flippase-like domain-containing protein [Calditrichia bacterium]
MKTGKSRYRWLYWLKLIAGVALIAVLYYKIDNRESIVDAINNAKLQYLVVCALLLLPNIYLAYLKWRYLLNNRFAGIRNKDVLGSLLFGYTLGLITPGRIGELGRGLFFPGQDRLTITGLNVLDKAANQVIIFTLGGIALLTLIFHYQAWSIHDARWLLFIGAAALVAVWVVVLNPSLLKKILQQLQKRLPPGSRRRSMLQTFDEFTFANSLTVLFLSLVWYLVIILQYHVLVNAFTEVGVTESFLAVSAMLFVKTLLPVTFGDLGIREGIAVFFYGFFAVSEAAVFNASLLIFVLNFLLPALLGTFYLFKLRELKQNNTSTSNASSGVFDATLASKK